ncbi:hypothetical protein [Halalkalibacterium ligniniphilum]|uniref:hypothetical protein n=1 Tax=Halalkalibacterium ligniniphilum TaxID=1134413 RepID=UPI00034D6B22|nr:hypothetical protein [Halalkalibacterium ligniniphilum]
MKRKLNITAILMACFLLLFFQHSAQAESTETVSVEKAIEAIQNIHENMPQSEKEELGWGEIELNHMLDLYDINDDIVA